VVLVWCCCGIVVVLLCNGLFFNLLVLQYMSYIEACAEIIYYMSQERQYFIMSQLIVHQVQARYGDSLIARMQG